MNAVEVLTRRFDVAPEVLWGALETTLAPGEVGEAKDADELTMQVRFTTSISLTSWGRDLTASVEPSQRGGSLLRVAGQRRSGFLSMKRGEERHADKVEREPMSATDRALD